MAYLAIRFDAGDESWREARVEGGWPRRRALPAGLAEQDLLEWYDSSGKASGARLNETCAHRRRGDGKLHTIHPHDLPNCEVLMPRLTIFACMHSDFRIGGLQPGETKKIRGKLYIVPADVEALVKRYEKDFPKSIPGAFAPG